MYLKTQNNKIILIAIVIVVMLHSNKPILKCDVLTNNGISFLIESLTL